MRTAPARQTTRQCLGLWQVTGIVQRHQRPALPQAIKLTDAAGRSAIYVPIMQNGKVVDSHGFMLDRAMSLAVEA